MWPEIYIELSEFSSNEKVNCMRCGILIFDHTYEMMPKRNDPTQTVAVYSPRKLSNYRQVPYLTVKDGRESVTHLLLCVDCENFKLADEDRPLIINQITACMILQVRWAGYPETAVEGVREKWKGMEFIRRLNDTEAAKLYAGKELSNAGNI